MQHRLIGACATQFSNLLPGLNLITLFYDQLTVMCVSAQEFRIMLDDDKLTVT
jgi:hypothetical protein